MYEDLNNMYPPVVYNSEEYIKYNNPPRVSLSDCGEFWATGIELIGANFVGYICSPLTFLKSWSGWVSCISLQTDRHTLLLPCPTQAGRMTKVLIVQLNQEMNLASMHSHASNPIAVEGFDCIGPHVQTKIKANNRKSCCHSRTATSTTMNADIGEIRFVSYTPHLKYVQYVEQNVVQSFPFVRAFGIIYCTTLLQNTLMDS